MASSNGKKFRYGLVVEKVQDLFQASENHGLQVTLLQLRRDEEEQGCPRLAMPRIGCGLDRLDWRIVRSMLEVVFCGSGIRIIVFCFQPAGEEPSRGEDCNYRKQPSALGYEETCLQ
ncbi:hypothetical protein ILUMI_09885 [Ignelater luminosus]|uniref:Uncharacterized protein n=1 Tax=Ignelater luminosus TaxID=2038154 RepID=A0A8K0D883_IGNLU|nr:hypothetical protein ILUMI_09885 [Ignelater luminosus]